MKPRIALSAPMSIPLEHLGEVEQLINQKYAIPCSHISYWNRTSAYNDNEFNNADAVVIILPNFSFDSTKIKREWYVPIGVHRELQESEKQSKKVYIAYKTADGTLNLYQASYSCGNGGQFHNTKIKGIAGTSNEFGEWVYKLSKEDLKSETKQDFFVDPKEREEKLRQWAAAHRINQNSVYGAFGELDHPSEQVQVKFPEMRRVYAQLIPNPDYSDERLLLML